MSKISKEKKEKIMSNILSTLYEHNPKPLFTVEISRAQARDEEYTKKLLKELKSKGFVIEIKKNPKGIIYKRRARWRLTEKAYKIYKQHQETQESQKT